MRYTVRIFLFLIILGIIFVGCYLKLDSKTKLEAFYTENDSEIVKASYIDTLIQEHRRIKETNQANSEVANYFMIGENALPQIPGRIYVLKTESTAQIWHTARATTKSRNGEQISVKGPELSETQELDLLNTGVPPAGWEVVYVDEEGNPTHRNR